jgi:diguanylate cyclase (GGDEF)-like protein
VLGASGLASLVVLLIAHRALYQALQGSLWLAEGIRWRLNDLERRNFELYADRAALQTDKEALQTESRTDPLTGLANRRQLRETLDVEWNRCRREHRPLSCVILDVDHFKLFNDHYGHDSGDECLRRLGRVLGQSLRRAGDVAARYGGEEFMLVLPNTDIEGAMTVAEQLREAVAAERVAHAVSETAPHVTISLGTACLVPEEGVQLQELTKAADLALYEAKRQGRNRSVAADAEMHESARMAAKGMIG